MSQPHAEMQRVPIDLGLLPVRLLFLVFVTGQSNAYADVGVDAVVVHMGPGFRRRFRRDQVGRSSAGASRSCSVLAGARTSAGWWA